MSDILQRTWHYGLPLLALYVGIGWLIRHELKRPREEQKR